MDSRDRVDDPLDDPVIARYDDGTSLASAITKNLFDSDRAGPGCSPVKNPGGHVIRQYMKISRREEVNKDRPAGNENMSAHKKTQHNGRHFQQYPQSAPLFTRNESYQGTDTDLSWLDDPQTLYLKRKLHVHDSLTFVDNLARILSSSCVRDVMKKVKLVLDLVTSADRATYPVFAIDCDGKVIAWNKAMEEITAIPAHEMIGKGDHAYAVPLYGTVRPMLIDYLVLPYPRLGDAAEGPMIGSAGVLTSNVETVWIQGRPRIIWGRGTRIHNEEGTVVGAIQSIGIRDLSFGAKQSGREEWASGRRQACSLPLTSHSLNGNGPSPPAQPEAADSTWNAIGLPAGKIKDPEWDEPSLYNRHENLRDALRQLMAKEDDLLRNIGILSQDTRPPGMQDQEPDIPDNLFAQVIMDAREGIIAYDNDLRCILWNPFMEQLTGIPAAGVLGKKAFDMLPALRDGGACLLLDQALSGKSVESSDISCHIPMSGKQVWVRLIFSALRDSNGRVIGIIGIVQDTTARKVMEYALQTTIVQLMESEEKYRSVFNAKNDPLLLIDTTSRGILDLNTATSDLYGYRHEDFFTISPADLFIEPEKYNDLLTRQSPGTCTCRQRKKDGTVFPADISYAYFDLKGHLVLILSIRDLSTAYHAADALRLANTKLNLLIGVTRHDVINNLTVLMGYNDLMKHTVKDTKILAMLDKEEIALQAVHRQIEFTREYYNLGVKSPVWQNICETSTRAYSQFVTTMAFTCDTQDLEIYADPLLEKVFYNLFDNAIRHGESVNQIRIYCDRDGPDLLLIFGDDGQGVLPEDKERIFRRGFGKHTGLGLFLTREILAITRIEITETGEFEKGARFELRIPAGLYRFHDSGNAIKESGSETMNLHA
jgi:PAS domain S-box-containing protein